MNEHTLMNDEQLVEKAVRVLVREIGPVEAGRFLSMPQQQRLESVQRHHDWQKKLDKEAFFNEVFND